jgi:hypothetical protein
MGSVAARGFLVDLFAPWHGDLGALAAAALCDARHS